jgi:hypothetical protein
MSRRCRRPTHPEDRWEGGRESPQKNLKTITTAKKVEVKKKKVEDVGHEIWHGVWPMHAVPHSIRSRVHARQAAARIRRGDPVATQLCPLCYKFHHRARSVCSYCGRSCFATRDHVVPRLRGGQLTLDACRVCNEAKGSMSLAEWLETLPADAPQREGIAEIFRMFPDVSGDRTGSMKKTKKSLP